MTLNHSNQTTVKPQNLTIPTQNKEKVNQRDTAGKTMTKNWDRGREVHYLAGLNNPRG